MGYTENGVRYFKCKRCGCESVENHKQWKKKPQQWKNVCLKCIEDRRIQIQTAHERAEYEGYSSQAYKTLSKFY